MQERWKLIKGYSHYQVSDFGRVRSLPREIQMPNGITRSVWGGLLKPQPNGDRGYLYVSLSKKGRIETFGVHNLVAEAFLPPKPTPSHEADHIDSNPSNNHHLNLQWLTRSQNVRMGYWRKVSLMCKRSMDKIPLSER